jgi:cupin fold WbuC family metalloprotein
MMIIDKKVLYELTAQAKVNPCLRANLDLCDSTEDDSQRMLNAIEPGTVLTIHRHKASS